MGDKMEIGIIGLGDMGKMYAKIFSNAGYRVNGCDLPQKRHILEQELSGTNIRLFDDGVSVARRSDVIFYAVEAENIDSVVRQFGPSTKKGAIVSGLTSVKTPEILAFEKYLPKDVNIVTCHSLHGPKVSPIGESLAVIRHRSHDSAYNRAVSVFEKLGSKIIEIPTYEMHDRITADTQAVTHLGFESMGVAWKNAGIFPWENASYVGGIDTVKILMTLRIFSGKAHVYCGLAILNPFAKEQIRQYATSESELFKLMIQEDEKKFRDRLKKASDFVFSNNESHILLDDKIMGEFSLGNKKERKPNSHLSLLSMIDAWHKLKINPYNNMICQTPLFRLRLGIAEYLFKHFDLLEESINTALFDKSIRGDDLEFHTAVREWASIICNEDVTGYKNQFDSAKYFFKDRLLDGVNRSNELIKILKKGILI